MISAGPPHFTRIVVLLCVSESLAAAALRKPHDAEQWGLALAPRASGPEPIAVRLRIRFEADMPAAATGQRGALGFKFSGCHNSSRRNPIKWIISAARAHELGGRYARTSGTEAPPFFTEGGVESIAAKHVAIMRHRWRGCQEESRCHRIRPAEHLPKLFRTIIRHALIGDVVERPITERVGALRPDEPEPEPIDAEMIS